MEENMVCVCWAFIHKQCVWWMSPPAFHPAAPKIQVLFPLHTATTDQSLWTERRDADTISAASATSSILICANVSEWYSFMQAWEIGASLSDTHSMEILDISNFKVDP